MRALRSIVVLPAGRDFSGADRPPDHESKPFDHLVRPGELELRQIVSAQRAVAKLREVLRGMDERELLPGCRSRLDELKKGSGERFEDQAVLFRGKDVPPDIDVISRRIDDRQHGASRAARQLDEAAA